MTATIHGPSIQALLWMVYGADVKLNFMLKAIQKEVKGNKKDMQILECLDHLKSQHCQWSMFNSTTMHIRMCQFPLSFCP